MLLPSPAGLLSQLFNAATVQYLPSALVSVMLEWGRFVCGLPKRTPLRVVVVVLEVAIRPLSLFVCLNKEIANVFIFCLVENAY